MYNETMNEQMPEATPGAWEVVVDSCYQAPYMHNGPYWIGYDDEASLAIKAEFANHLGIAGAFVWSIDTDDFNGDNSDEKFPLMRTINRALVSKGGGNLLPSNELRKYIISPGVLSVPPLLVNCGK